MTILSKNKNEGVTAAPPSSTGPVSNVNVDAVNVSVANEEDHVVVVRNPEVVNVAHAENPMQVGWSASGSPAASVVGEKRPSSSSSTSSTSASSTASSSTAVSVVSATASSDNTGVDCETNDGARSKKRRRVAGGKRGRSSSTMNTTNMTNSNGNNRPSGLNNASTLSHASLTNPSLPNSPLTGSSLSNDVEERSGCNSEDEYVDSQLVLSENEWRERDRAFELMLRKKGLLIKHVEEDGSCLFRAVADQVYGDQEMHDYVRGQCMNYIIGNRDYFSEYLTEDISDYVERKRYLGVHGNHLEVQALSEMYNRPIHIYSYASEEPINIFQIDDNLSNPNSNNAPIRLSYQRGTHYNSIIDPHQATVGVGLGLPGHSPGSADRSLMRKACEASEQDLVEKTMLEDKIKATDWEATNEAIEEQVARESYLQWLRDNERRSKSSFNQQQQQQPVATVTSGAAGSCRVDNQCWNDDDQQRTSVSVANRFLAKVSPPSAGCSTDRDSPKPCSSHQRSPSARDRDCGGFPSSDQAHETAQFLNDLPPHMFGLDDWSDADVLTRVLAASQQEYLNSLKKQQQQQNSKKPNAD